MTHGHHGRGKRSGTYSTWDSMIQRCTNPNARNYKHYGGRGIGICQRWRESFAAFLKDMGEKPPGMSIDRIDNDGNYEPSNCRWATQSEQLRNTRRTTLSPQLVQEIHGRIEHGEKPASVARRLGLTRSNVSAVRTGRIWRNHLHGFPPDSL